MEGNRHFLCYSLSDSLYNILCKKKGLFTEYSKCLKFWSGTLNKGWRGELEKEFQQPGQRFDIFCNWRGSIQNISKACYSTKRSKIIREKSPEEGNVWIWLYHRNTIENQKNKTNKPQKECKFITQAWPYVGLFLRINFQGGHRHLKWSMSVNPLCLRRDERFLSWLLIKQNE